MPEKTTERGAGLSVAKRALLDRWKRGEGGAGKAELARAEELRPRQDPGPAPLSSGQRRFWFLDQLEPGNPAYHLPAVVRLTGRLEIPALARAFAEILKRHEVLRSGLKKVSEHPVQVVQPQVSFSPPSADLSTLDPSRRGGESRRRAQEEALRPFDLRSAPLLRVLLFVLGKEEHLLVVTMHHVVSDGWSMGVLLRELSAIYEAGTRGEPSPLPPLRLQYGDYATWQQRWLASGSSSEALGFWKEKLAGAPELLELPADRPRPALRTSGGGSVPVAFSPDSTAAITALARREGTTLFVALLSVFETLLSRYTGKRDLLVGSPVAGRNRKGLEALVGLFVNTLVLRADLAGHTSFRKLLARNRAGVLEAFDHQDLPFERLVEELRPGRDLNGNPLFQLMFALQNTPLPEIRLPELHLRQEDLPSRTAMLDLTLSLREREGGVAGALDFSVDLFEATTAERMAAHLGCLLRGAAEDPDRRLCDLPLLTPEEHGQLHAWNDRAAPFPRDACLHQKFAAWAAETPDTPAVVAGHVALSYGELRRRALRLAGRLRGCGVGPETPVGLLAGRSPDMVVGIFGILEAGGAYLPLDESFPRERLALILEDAGVRVLVSDRAPGKEPDLGDSVRVISARDIRDRQHPGGGNAGHSPAASDPERLAYVIYTSGSTGRPKGVSCKHLGVLNLMFDMEGRRPLVPGEGCFLWTSISFDVSVWEIFSALSFGGVLHLPAEEERTRAETLFPWMERHRVKSGYLPPFLLAEYLERVRAGEAERRAFGRLLVGVEPIPEKVLSGLMEAVPELKIVNGYGPTEATVCATFYNVKAGLIEERRTPLGLPVSNNRVYLLDPHQREVPVGVPGEIWIGGSGLARGYFGRPALTADRFVPDPVMAPGAAPGARCYRTGDLARRWPTGHLEFLERRDHQVKLRGFRIEPAEIEAALALHPEVAHAAVAVREDPRGEKRLLAYLVAKNRSFDVAGVRDFLRERLPEAMIPSIFVRLDALPMTPSSKLDRVALPEPDWELARAGSERPETPTETLLASIWSDLLGRDGIGVRDDFFDLGGHSLLATQVISRVREVFEVELPVRGLFEAPTIEALAWAVDSLRGTAPFEAPAIRAVPREGGLPLSFAQQRLWFLDHLEPGNPAYNVPWVGELRGELDLRVLLGAFSEIVRRHEAFRTRFSTSADRPAQWIAESLELRVPIVSLEHLPGERAQREALRLATADAIRPFDLATGPLIRVTLLRTSERQHTLLVTVHHIVTDGWSMGILVREFTACYGAFRRGEAASLDELPIQYADFAAWQRSWLTGEVLKRGLTFWRDQLADAPRQLELTTDRPRPAMPSLRGRARSIALSADLLRSLTDLCRRQGVTPFMVLLAAFGTLLGRWANQRDLLVGTPIANRNRREIEGLIGFFVNTLVLRVELSGSPSFTDLLSRVRERALGAYAHQDVPFEKLVDELEGDREPSRSPLFQVMLVLQNVPIGELALPGLTLSSPALTSQTSKFDLTLVLSASEDGLIGTFEYSTDLFEATTMHRTAGRFEQLLRELVAKPQRGVDEVPLLTWAERHQLSVEWNDSRQKTSRDVTVTSLVAAQAARGPQRRAVVSSTTCLAYEELDRRANALAHHLVELGLGPETRAAVLMERSAEMVLTLLAVLKAGGAYVPLDPTHPRDWLSFMLRDSRPVVLLTEEPFASSLEDTEEMGCRVIILDRGGPRLKEEAADPPMIELSSRNSAYVIYTSGSTGRPKGVVVEHGGLANLVSWHREAYDQGSADRLTHVAGPAFDASVWEIWAALASGSSLHLPDEEIRYSAQDLVAWMAREKITQSFLPTPLAEAVLAETWPAEMNLRFLLTGGDRLHKSPRDAGGFVLVNHYGPTENSVVATATAVPPGSSSPPVGRPIDNVAVFLVDRGLRPVPIGTGGELAIGGGGVARAYLGRPGRSAERFVPDSFSGRPGRRIYRTGDLVRSLADGQIDFLGRIDHQVKVRGFRIELGEIETVLAQLPGVRSAAVLLREDRPGNKRLVAYVSPGRDSTAEDLALQDLRQALRKRLPEYMVPSAFVALEELPTNRSGKVDRTALPEPESPADPDSAAPGTPIEAKLSEIWSEILGISKVGVRDNFFDLGGDSILGIQVVAKAQQAGLTLTAKDLFQHQTIAELAAVTRTAPRVSASQEESGEIVPTPIQRWFFELDLADPHHFNQALLIDLKETASPPYLEGALAAVLEQHDALKYRFRLESKEIWRASFVEAPVGSVDLTRLPEPARRDALERAASRLQGSLAIGRGPLLRAAIFYLRPDSQRFFLVIHHLVVDGISWRVLLADLEAAWRSLREGDIPSLPPVTTSLSQWSRRLQGHAGSLSTELDYWLDEARHTVRDLPVDHIEGADTVASGRLSVAELDRASTDALLKEVPPVYHTRIEDALVTALAEAVRDWSGENRLLLDLEGHGREDLFEDSDLSRTVGWFTALYPVLLELRPADRDPGQRLMSIKEQLRSVPGKGVGYGVLRYLGDEETVERLRRMPAPQMVFNYLGQLDRAVPESSLFAPASESGGAARSPRQARDHLLEINGGISGGRLRMTFTYSENRHRPETIHSLKERFLTSLRDLIRHCQTTTSGSFTPSDFPEARVSQQDLDKLMGQIGKRGRKKSRKVPFA